MFLVLFFVVVIVVIVVGCAFVAATTRSSVWIHSTPHFFGRWLQRLDGAYACKTKLHCANRNNKTKSAVRFYLLRQLANKVDALEATHVRAQNCNHTKITE